MVIPIYTSIYIHRYGHGHMYFGNLSTLIFSASFTPYSGCFLKNEAVVLC